jgi:hypothetical protein
MGKLIAGIFIFAYGLLVVLFLMTQTKTKCQGEAVPYSQLQAGQYVVDMVVTTHGGLAVARRVEGEGPDQYRLVFVSGIPGDKLGEGNSFSK